MFDGTDLSLAYGDVAYQPLDNMDRNEQQKFSPDIDEQVEPQRQSMPPPIQQQVQQPTYYQPSPQQPRYVHKQPEQPSLWDKMGTKKGEMYKLIIFALIIVLAMAIDKIFFHYLKTYLDENALTWTQEFIVRLAYPISILLVIWIVKSL